MTSTNSAYNELLEKLTSSESAIASRLKWAVGANAKLVPVLADFEKAQTARAALFQVFVVTVASAHTLLTL